MLFLTMLLLLMLSGKELYSHNPRIENKVRRMKDEWMLFDRSVDVTIFLWCRFQKKSTASHAGGIVSFIRCQQKS